jgi:hypothetical protein
MSKTNTTPEVATEVLAVETKVERRGRPVTEGSARQAKLAARAARVAAGGSTGKGRPASPTSARSIRLAEKAARIAAGVTIKAGRPKLVKPEVVAEVTAETVPTEVVEAVEA